MLFSTYLEVHEGVHPGHCCFQEALGLSLRELALTYRSLSVKKKGSRQLDLNANVPVVDGVLQMVTFFGFPWPPSNSHEGLPKLVVQSSRTAGIVAAASAVRIFMGSEIENLRIIQCGLSFSGICSRSFPGVFQMGCLCELVNS